MRCLEGAEPPPDSCPDVARGWLRREPCCSSLTTQTSEVYSLRYTQTIHHYFLVLFIDLVIFIWQLGRESFWHCSAAVSCSCRHPACSGKAFEAGCYSLSSSTQPEKPVPASQPTRVHSLPIDLMLTIHTTADSLLPNIKTGVSVTFVGLLMHHARLSTDLMNN